MSDSAYCVIQTCIYVIECSFPIDGQNNRTVLEQGKQINVNKKIKNYIMVVPPMFSKSSLSVCKIADGIVRDTQNAIEKAYQDINADTGTR